MATTVKTLRLTVANTEGTQTINFRNPTEDIDGEAISNFNTAVTGSGISVKNAQYITTVTDDMITPQNPTT